ncbi:winged helix-turn-helix transcriptional regulator [Streptomyces sp. NA02950]|uniref:MarR family winged helix-turn-helix transcriptional regulator n=1 Tax=Streptomyces sp. NA02950 TaxID=2742137 RepID=UPI0015925131|nr:MarR family winged helix-turn-helix transcriptional regulator [Streptomyces sp. NA02950]QKV95769.1 winged helix-turn-helix transcriptional regulator [Streptomyces sp. NA02950]
MGNNSARHIEDIERAMVAIRRSQSRRSLARLGGQRRSSESGKGGGAAFDVLDAIEAAEQSGTPATVSGIAAALDVDQPRASKLVTGAVDAGLARREADQTDGRRALLVMTEAGRALTEEVHRFRRSVFAEAMEEWPETDRAEFARLLTSFVDALGRRTSG